MRDGLIDTDAFRRIIAEREISLAELARKSGVSLSMIKYAVAGTWQLSDRTARPVARVLKCKVSDFTVPRPTADREDVA